MANSMLSDYVKETLTWLLSTYCTEREQWVIKRRFGLESTDYRSMLLEDVAKEYPWGHVTRERIRQIEAQALRKMRPQLANRLDECDWMLELLPYLHLARALRENRRGEEHETEEHT